jgi:hypothetical protein
MRAWGIVSRGPYVLVLQRIAFRRNDEQAAALARKLEVPDAIVKFVRRLQRHFPCRRFDTETHIPTSTVKRTRS